MRTTRRPETFMALACAALMVTAGAGALATSCAHASPIAFANCMENSAAGAALINAVNDILDGDNRTAVLEQLAVAIGPDVLKCALQQIASEKAAGATTPERARRAREYLDAHGGGQAMDFKKGGGVKPATCVGALPRWKAADEGSSAVGSRPTPGHPVLAGFCGWGPCNRVSSLPPGIGPGPGGG